MELIKKENIDILRFSFNIVKKNYLFKYEFKTNTNKIISNYEYKNEVFKNLLNTEDFSNIWNCIFKRSILNDIKFDKNIKYGEDLLYSYMSLLKAKNIMLIPNSLYNYVYNEMSASKNVSLEQCIRRLSDEIIVNSRVCHIFSKYTNLENNAISRVKNCFNCNLKLVAFKYGYSQYKEYICSALAINTIYIKKKYIIRKKNFFSYIIYKTLGIFKSIVMG